MTTVEITWDWERLLSRTPTGHVRPTVSNALHILGHHPAWMHVLAFDEFRFRPVFLAPPPFDDQTARRDIRPDSFATGLLLVEQDYARINVWLERSKYAFSLARDAVRELVSIHSRGAQFHPVREYLRAVTWDRIPRLDSFCHHYLGAENDQLSRRAGRLWLLSAVARICQPGCQADCVIILEGPQGIGKSTALQKLFSDDWFLSTHLDLGNKEVYMAMEGKWGIEFAELDSIKKSDNSRVKAFFAERFNAYVPKYESTRVEPLRQCVFAGTVNEYTYLVDPTGARRFLPITCGKTGPINRDAIQADRDQLWAEAYYVYISAMECEIEGSHRKQAGEPVGDVCTRTTRCSEHAWWPVGADHALFSSAQAERYDADVWTELVQAYLSESTARFHSTTHILKNVIGLDPEKQSRREQGRVASIMRHLGYRECTGTFGGKRARGWVHE
jgi:predicted P-loop ATPase